LHAFVIDIIDEEQIHPVISFPGVNKLLLHCTSFYERAYMNTITGGVIAEAIAQRDRVMRI
ncbi:MAG TPA: hypothetical protein VFP87_14990, partial [Chitinophagaceae bacterium]|nr:hypothetical protein [Chitinophagaceae bacterium]